MKKLVRMLAGGTTNYFSYTDIPHLRKIYKAGWHYVTLPFDFLSNKIQRLLRLMLMLSSNVDYTTSELADILEITERSAFRYLRSFKDSGFIIQKRSGNIHKLLQMPVRQIKLSDLIHISPEEAHILHSLLISISGDS